MKETKEKLYVYSIFRFTSLSIFLLSSSSSFLNHHFVFLSIDKHSTTTMMALHLLFSPYSFFCRSNFSTFSDDWNFWAVLLYLQLFYVSLDLTNYCARLHRSNIICMLHVHCTRLNDAHRERYMVARLNATSADCTHKSRNIDCRMKYSATAFNIQ